VYIVKVSHDHVLLVQICNNLMHMWPHVTNHLIISINKDSNSEVNKNYVSVTVCTGMGACHLKISMGYPCYSLMDGRQMI
jgi:hypothetical protein